MTKDIKPNETFDESIKQPSPEDWESLYKDSSVDELQEDYEFISKRIKNLGIEYRNALRLKSHQKTPQVLEVFYYYKQLIIDCNKIRMILRKFMNEKKNQ